MGILLFFAPFILSAQQTLTSVWVDVNKQGCKVLDTYYKTDATLT
jgi:hypothetical protein